MELGIPTHVNANGTESMLQSLVERMLFSARTYPLASYVSLAKELRRGLQTHLEPAFAVTAQWPTAPVPVRVLARCGTMTPVGVC